MLNLSSSSAKVCLVIDNNIFDLFTEPLKEQFPEFEFIYLGEVYQEGQDIPDIPENELTKENREIVESMLKVSGYSNRFPCSFPIRFDSGNVHELAQKYEKKLGRTDAYLIAVTKHFPKPAILVTNDGLKKGGLTKGLIKNARAEGIVVAFGNTIEDLKNSIDEAVQQLEDL